MLASVIQLRQLVFQRVCVEEADPDSTKAGAAIDFDFDGVTFHLNQDFRPIKPEEGDEPVGYVVSLGIKVDNTEGKLSPYKIDVLALGVVEVSKKLENEKRSNIAAVNGMSLVFGAIREIVTSITARSLPGPLVLPTMDFRDYLDTLAVNSNKGQPGSE